MQNFSLEGKIAAMIQINKHRDESFDGTKTLHYPKVHNNENRYTYVIGSFQYAQHRIKLIIYIYNL